MYYFDVRVSENLIIGSSSFLSSHDFCLIFGTLSTLIPSLLVPNNYIFNIFKETTAFSK